MLASTIRLTIGALYIILSNSFLSTVIQRKKCLITVINFAGFIFKIIVV